MTLQTSATPINGKEAADIIIRQFIHLIDSTPGLELARSYHRFSIKGWFKVTAYPNDDYSRFPEKELEFDVNSPATSKKENEEHFEYINRLETIREDIIAYLQKLEEHLENIAPVTGVEFDLNTIRNGEDVPDALRIEQGLPIPVTTRAGNRTVETYVQASKNASTGAFQFGKGRNNT